MENEEIEIGFKLVRDALIFTNKRIILTDQIEATGVRMRIESINLYSVVAISMETAGLNFDHPAPSPSEHSQSPDTACRQRRSLALSSDQLVHTSFSPFKKGDSRKPARQIGRAHV